MAGTIVSGETVFYNEALLFTASSAAATNTAVLSQLLTYTTNTTSTTITAGTIGVTNSATGGAIIMHDETWRAWARLQEITRNTWPTDALDCDCDQTWSMWSTAQHAAQVRAAVAHWQHWNEIREARVEDVQAQLRNAEERHRQRVADHARRVAEADAANRRAEDLLRRELTEEQNRDLDKKGCFYLETVDRDGSRRRYRIDRGTHGNVKRVDEKGSILESLCIQPDNVPAADAMLAQKLWIESDEATFRRVANITRHR